MFVLDIADYPEWQQELVRQWVRRQNLEPDDLAATFTVASEGDSVAVTFSKFVKRGKVVTADTKPVTVTVPADEVASLPEPIRERV